MRLTLWYLAVLGGILVLFAVGTSVFLFLHLRNTLDEAVADDVESVEAQLSFRPDGTLSGPDGARQQDPDAQQDRYLEILSPNGSLLYRNDRLRDRTLGGFPSPGEGKNGYSQYSILLQNGPRLRVASRLHMMGARSVLIRLGHSEEPLWREFKELLWVLFLGLPIALSLAGLGGYALARRALAPIDRITRRAEQITAERLGERLPVDNPEDEIGHLARVFNDTLTRLERSFEQLRRFTADASHELRTPLTAIRSVGEVGLQKTSGSVSYYRDIIGSMLEEANRLTHLVDTLLTISRADSGQLQLQRTNLSLLNVARESAGLLEVLAEEKQQQLIVQGDERAIVSGDRLILRQALMNLVDNAIKYSPAGETVLVGVARDKGDSVIEVIDHGPGIPLEHQAKVFERFYRVDKARSQQSGGAGLGLSIVRWAVEAHGGKVELFTEEGKGSTFRITLPAVPVEHLVAA
jgi:heavy metal sensor kinase